jgi:hypothetical protein
VTLSAQYKEGLIPFHVYVGGMIALGGRNWARDAMYMHLTKDERVRAEAILLAHQVHADNQFYKKFTNAK